MNNIPYIKKENRGQYEEAIKLIVAELQAGTEIDLEFILDFSKRVLTAGDANYVISSIIWRLFDAKPSYTYGNNLISVVDDVKACLANKNAWVERAIEPFFLFLKAFCYGIRYNFAGVRGMLTSVILEFYRRRLAGYEDLKINENGDIL